MSGRGGGEGTLSTYTDKPPVAGKKPKEKVGGETGLGKKTRAVILKKRRKILKNQEFQRKMVGRLFAVKAWQDERDPLKKSFRGGAPCKDGKAGGGLANKNARKSVFGKGCKKSDRGGQKKKQRGVGGNALVEQRPVTA